MFQEAFNSILQEAGQDAVINNSDIPNEHNEAVLNEAQASVTEGMQQVYQQQGSAGLLSLFKGAEANDAANPAMQQVSGNFVDRITSKLGISKGTAMSIAGMLIPVVMSKILHRGRQGAQGQPGGLDIGGLLGSIMGGGGGGGLGGMLGGMLGGGQQQAAPAGRGGMGSLSGIGAALGMDKDGDGDTDLNDLMGMFRR